MSFINDNRLPEMLLWVMIEIQSQEYIVNAYMLGMHFDRSKTFDN